MTMTMTKNELTRNAIVEAFLNGEKQQFIKEFSEFLICECEYWLHAKELTKAERVVLVFNDENFHGCFAQTMNLVIYSAHGLLNDDEKDEMKAAVEKYRHEIKCFWEGYKYAIELTL